jgi:16S rRNA (guanine527-N7)-methyltransferase
MVQVKELIKEGLACLGIEHCASAGERLVSYVAELERWNRKVNLTGLRDRRRIVCDLVYDAFFLHTRIGARRTILDLGSGSGVLAIPLAVLNPDTRVFSIDKSLRKVDFQKHVKRLLCLSLLEPIHARAADVPPLGVEALVAKAFGPTPAVLAEGERHLAEGGLAFVVKGRAEQPAGGHPGFLLEATEHYALPKSDRHYQLFVYKKVP